MAEKKESSLQVIAALLGIIASMLALQDWYGGRAAAPPNAAAAMMGLHGPAGSGTTPAAPAVTQAPPAAQASAPAATPPHPAPASVAGLSVSVPAAPAAAPNAPPSAPAPAAGTVAVAPSSASPAHGPPVATPPPPTPPRETAADPFMALVSAPDGARTGVAAAVRGEGAERLLSGLEQQGVDLMRDFFQRGFASSPYFSQMLGGNASALVRSGALAAGSRVLVGEMESSFHPEGELVVCDLTFTYVVLDARGRRLVRRSIRSSMGGDDRAAALNETIAVMLRDHGDTLAREAGG